MVIQHPWSYIKNDLLLENNDEIAEVMNTYLTNVIAAELNILWYKDYAENIDHIVDLRLKAVGTYENHFSLVAVKKG